MSTPPSSPYAQLLASAPRYALLVAYLGLLLSMDVVSWETAKIDLSDAGRIFGALAAGLLGAVINPAKAGDDAKAPKQPAEDALWSAQIVVGCAALMIPVLALMFDGGSHVNAPAAFVAIAAAFSALFLNTSGLVHDVTTVVGKLAAVEGAAGAGGPATVPNPRSAADDSTAADSGGSAGSPADGDPADQ